MSHVTSLVEQASEAKLALEGERLVRAYRTEIKQGGAQPADYAEGRAILAADPRIQIHALFYILTLDIHDWALDPLKSNLFSRALPWSTSDLERLLPLCLPPSYSTGDAGGALRAVQRHLQQGNSLTTAIENALRAIKAALRDRGDTDSRRVRARLYALLGEIHMTLPDAGESWSDVALAEVCALPVEAQAAWKRLFAHAQDCEAGKPTRTWRDTARALVDAIGAETFRASIVGWCAAVTLPPIITNRHEYSGHVYETHRSGGSDRNISLLKGLAWACVDQPTPEIARAMARLAESSLKKLPGIGPWAVRAAFAAIWTLTEMECAEAVGQLGRLKTKVTFRSALNQIEKGLDIAAQRAGVTKADLEDMSVPAFGFDAAGVRRETFGECAAVATIATDGEITIEWFSAGGKPVKSAPAEARKSHAGDLKAFKTDVDAASKMLTAQKARFDSFYVPERAWPLQTWRDRFVAHPILGAIARRLIWHLSEGERRAQGIWSAEADGFVDVRGEPITGFAPSAEVRLWHPIGFEVETVLAWRGYLQQHEIVQPFKQAYREIYLLTEAELQTGTYSNRFAGHILKQHQMNSLAGLRGWRNQLRMMVDGDYPPATKELPEYALRAEFWVEGVGEVYGTDTNDSGAYLYLATDQVRFYRIDAPDNYAHAYGGGYATGRWASAVTGPADALPLTEVSAIVFSELMRDVDLFVGVCSVGNDPTWQDGGPAGRYREYWSDYSFGDLSATAQTRRAVLERLLPRLKIASRCTLTDRFLRVQGDLRAYKIHLGSGNILMEPNDQYLCIVQDRGTGRNDVPVHFLPFEGDQRLALILSKAFLLADDTRITDLTITRQLQL